MANVSLTSPMEIQTRGLQALKEVLGPVDMARFLQQYDSGHGDYTKEKWEEPDLSMEELDVLLKTENN